MKRRTKVLLISFGILLTLVLVVMLYIKLAPQFGAKPSGERLARIEKSPNHGDGRFQNPVATTLRMSPKHMFDSMGDFLTGGADRVPDAPIPSVALDPDVFQRRSDELALTWLGHSTVLIEIAGKIILTDPMFGPRSSPVSFAGPKAFPYTEPFAPGDLPEVDAVIISHDHYDHLDYHTILAIKDRVPVFVTALGVGAHLEHWGVPPAKIIELDWGDEHRLGDLAIVAAPARHFSGRVGTYGFKTLFAAWVLRGPAHRVFFGGDSGYFDGFAQIGEEHGPFDVTMLECGAYSEYWPLIHMMPEETARAHVDLQGRVLLPIHWGKFNLSLHGWTEPVERLLAAAEGSDIEVTTPRPGERFIAGGELPRNHFWR
jgi:L-ascorbate metabolism protein UlaG (beta-lactamase superfamily)